MSENQITEFDLEAQKNQVKVNFDNKVDMKDFKFHFKSTKLETGDVIKRPTVEVSLPIPSVEGIVAIFEAGGKQLDLLMESVQDVILARARELINDKEDISQENFPFEELSWEKIANLPKAERRGGGISKEVWEEFSKDYIAVMPAVTGKSIEQVANAAKIFLTKFNTVKTNKKVLELLKGQLALYISNSSNAETYTDCVSFLVDKADALLNMDENALLSNL